jgi:hypothetical protein
MLLIIDKCLMTIEQSPKGRNPNITAQTKNLLKKVENHFSCGL